MVAWKTGPGSPRVVKCRKEASQAEEHVRELFPLADWFRADGLHRAVAAATHHFVKVPPPAQRRPSLLPHLLKTKSWLYKR